MQSFSSIDAKAVNENQTQPRSQSSSAISDVTSPVKLVEKVRQGLGSKPPLVTRIARTGQGTRLNQTHSSVENTENTMKMIEQEDFVVTSSLSFHENKQLQKRNLPNCKKAPPESP